MKTKEQVIHHLETAGYTGPSINKIIGFLIGCGINEENEEVRVLYGANTWDDFWAWFHREEEKKECCAICKWLEEIADEMEKEENPKRVQRLHDRYTLLLDIFGIDV
jgi:hypothetical protein